MGETDAQRRPLARQEVALMAADIRTLLSDPDTKLSADRRLRWEGALTALEAILGLDSSLVGEDSSNTL